MRGITFFLFWLLISSAGASIPDLADLPISEAKIREDLALITDKVVLGKWSEGKKNLAKVNCTKKAITIDVEAPLSERPSTLYKVLRKMGFLFPHPRTQITPEESRMRQTCGQTITWSPALKYRGFHLHNLHPNEWVHGFYMDRPKIAVETVRWLARNGQNLLDMNIMRRPELESLSRQMRPPFELARSLGVHTGISLGLAFTQQKSYKLLSLWQVFTGWGADESIDEGLEKLFEAFPLSFLVLEKGTSEFTPTSYEKTLHWLNHAARKANSRKVALLTKVHCSTNQKHGKYGNYNYLPQYADSSVGILPHTVMFYGLLDKQAPIYGNKDFTHLKEFVLQEKDKRRTWYYPETSYWVAMDVDIPLMLTDYLYTRTQDIRWLHENGVEGNLNFTTGHALGYWLFDWNTALIVDLDYDFDPLTTVKLLGEDSSVWEKHMDFQHKWFKNKGVIAMLSSANLQDELSEHERIHDRFTMKQLWNNKKQSETELAQLEEALAEWPEHREVRNEELRKLFEITKLRLQHAIQLRHSFIHRARRKQFVDKAKEHRRVAQDLIAGMRSLPTNYPEIPIFEKHENPTSYQFGYAYPAASGYFWKREERQASSGSFAPWNGNMYDVWNIIF